MIHNKYVNKTAWVKTASTLVVGIAWYMLLRIAFTMFHVDFLCETPKCGELTHTLLVFEDYCGCNPNVTFFNAIKQYAGVISVPAIYLALLNVFKRKTTASIIGTTLIILAVLGVIMFLTLSGFTLPFFYGIFY